MKSRPTDGLPVICDACSTDFTFSSAQGGLVVLSSAYCPDCTPRMQKNLRRYNEEHHIQATCPDNMSFAEFVVRYRTGTLPAESAPQYN